MKAIDTETYLFIPGLAAPKMVVCQVADEKTERLHAPKKFAEEVEDVLTFDDPRAFANAPYDLGVACAIYPWLLKSIFEMLERGLVRDTHVRQALLDIGRGTLLQGADGAPIERYSLDNVSRKTLGYGVQKENTPRLFYARLDGVPFDRWSEEERAYALKDARVTYDVVDRQGKGAPDDPGIANLALEIRENRAAWALHLMRCWGPRTDPAIVKDVTREVTAAHEETIRRFTEAGIYRGEGWCRGAKQCEGKEPHRFSEECWKPWLPGDVGTKDTAWLKFLVKRAYQDAPPKTATDGISTDRDTLLESGDDLLMAFAEAGKNEKEFSTYLDVISAGTKVPINVEYDVIKRTTRVSARRPNLQNLPRGGRSRECFVARPGTVWCSVDYPSLELVTLAQNLLWMFGESTLAKTLQTGEDVHVRLASSFDGISYEEAFKKYKAKDSRMKLLRQSAKPVNYGLGGGMGEEKLVVYARQPSNGGIRFCLIDGAQKCGEEKYMSERMGKPLCRRCVEVARKFREAWFDLFPEMRWYHKKVGEETEIPDESLIEVRGPEGEPSLWVRGRRFSEAANLRFQGLAARLTKDAIWRVAKACYVQEDSPLFGARPVLFVHDELIVEIPEERASAAAWEQATLMTDAAGYWCPDVPCKPEPALMRRWFKGAERFEVNGELRPWWPDGWEKRWPADAPMVAADRASRI